MNGTTAIVICFGICVAGVLIHEAMCKDYNAEVAMDSENGVKVKFKHQAQHSV